MAPQPIRVAVAGHGNLGRSAIAAITQQPDMRLVGLFSRRAGTTLKLDHPSFPVWPLVDAAKRQPDVDVLVLCGGSKADLPQQGPELARWFTTVDSFDTHAHVPDYFAAVDHAARAHQNLSIISTGWDPGLFSLNRALFDAVLPEGHTETFWGKGLSQGHSDALRRVPGVQDAVQYTVPNEVAMARVRNGEHPTLSTRDKHTRECYVVLAPGADADAVKQAIVTMPDYFADYDTTVHFISAETLHRDHAGMAHGGFVIRSGKTQGRDTQTLEFSLKLQSNPGFTGSVLVAYARAAWRMRQAGEIGARTVLDVAPGLLSPKSAETLRKTLI